MRKCDFNKVGWLLLRNHTSAWVSCCIFAGYMQNKYFEEHLWETASEFVIIKLVKIIFKSLWYFAYLNLPLLHKFFFFNWCNYPNIHVRDIKMLGINCSLQLLKMIIQIYLKTLLTSEITWDGFLLKHPVVHKFY